VKKLFTLCFVSLYLISTTELREIVKLPVLIQHFYEHKALNHEITFSVYLSDHYNAIPHTDNDEERDNQLPFKTADLNNLSMPAIPAFYEHHFKKTVCIRNGNVHSLYIESFIPAPDEGKVWQPPKA